MELLLEDIPEEFHDAFATIVELTDSFCRQRLDENYRELAGHMALEVCCERSPINVNKGRPKSWAAGIVHALGMVNFLHDDSFQPYMSSADLAKGLGVSQGTMTGKSKIIRDVLDIMPMDPRWCLPELLERNPLVWMLEINGFIMDMRAAPLDLQRQAYQQGLIPYIPAEQEPEPKEAHEAKILKFPAPQNNNAEKPQPEEEPKDDNQLTLF